MSEETKTTSPSGIPAAEVRVAAALPATPSQSAHPSHHRKPAHTETAFGCPRNFLDNRFVYTVISARARGFSIGVNITPDRLCNFDCVYCEVDRNSMKREDHLDIDVMTHELQRTLALVYSGQVRRLPQYSALHDELLELRHVALSGDGEPTLSSSFADAVRSVIHVRALGKFPFFKVVLITNGSGFDRPEVQQSLKLLSTNDEVWIKLDAGTQAYMDRVNHPKVDLSKVLANILWVGRQRPVVIQSLFPLIAGNEPPTEEIEQYAHRLQELTAGGAQISLVQIYSASRPIAHLECSHLPLKCLSHIAQTIRQATGLHVEVY